MSNLVGKWYKHKKQHHDLFRVDNVFMWDSNP